MTYLNAFITCGLVCLLGQIILDNTKLTPGHVTSILVCLGAILSFLGLYEYITEFSTIGSSIPITSFGNALYKAAFEGFQKAGFIGMFANLLSTTSTGITSAVFIGFIFSLIFNVRD